MISTNIHESFAEAYREGLHDLIINGQSVPSVKDPTSIASNFGKADRPSLELLGYSFQVNNPFSSLFLSDFRRVRIPYCIGLFLWSIAGSNLVDWLSYYNPVASQFSDDGSHLRGAFGKRLFAYQNTLQNTLNQIDAIYARLTRDPTSRRTLAVISAPEDNIVVSREYPCCIALQYFLRDGVLHAMTYMRAQQALTVLPYDAFLFMTLQCMLASRLGVKVGHYRHITGTFHIYETEIELTKQVISSGLKPVQIGKMPNVQVNMDELLSFEGELRKATIEKDLDKIEQMILEEISDDTFFAQAKAILIIHSLLLLNKNKEVDKIVSNVSASIKTLIRNYIEVSK